MSRIAAQVAANKAAHPEKYCRAHKCLWRMKPGETHCPRHRESDEAFIAAKVSEAVAPIKADAVASYQARWTWYLAQGGDTA